MIAREEVFFHNLQADFALDDATRGAVAIPYVYPPRECTMSGRRLRLVDGGLSNLLPVDYLFAPPFCSQQVLAVDVSNRARQRQANLTKVEALSRAGYQFAYTACPHREPKYPQLTIERLLLWEGSSIDADGEFSSAVFNCQVHDLWPPARRCERLHA